MCAFKLGIFYRVDFFAIYRHARRDELRMPISMVRCCASVGVCWAALLIINFALGGSGMCALATVTVHADV